MKSIKIDPRRSTPFQNREMKTLKNTIQFTAILSVLLLLNHCEKTTTSQLGVESAEEAWLLETTENQITNSDEGIVPLAEFRLDNGGVLSLVNLSDSDESPNIAVITIHPKTSNGRSNERIQMSPLEIFMALAENGQEPPSILSAHHQLLARNGIVDETPRDDGTPPWGFPDDEIPPEFGPVDLCGDFGSWEWFSFGHGTNNQSTITQLWTGWSVITGTSGPRSAALCMKDVSSNPDDAKAQYVISNKEGNDPWQTIYISEWLGKAEGIGFQTYGPGNGRTRISLKTQNDMPYIFFAGASWGNPSGWFSPN